MQRPKITIIKKFIYDEAGHYRYLSPYCVPGQKKVKAPTFNLEPITEYNKYGQPYPVLNITTEKQLAMFLRNTWGYGEYKALAHLAGRKGLYIFWNGIIEHDGWSFYNQESDKKDIEKLKDELAKAGTEEEVAELKDDISFFKEIAVMEKKDRRYGFAPFLRASGRRGEYNSWEDLDIGTEPRQPSSRVKNYKGEEIDPNLAW